MARTAGVYHQKQAMYETEQAKIMRDQLIMIFDKYFEIDSLDRKRLNELDDVLFIAIMGRFRNVRNNYIEGITKKDNNKPVEIADIQQYKCNVRV